MVLFLNEETVLEYTAVIIALPKLKGMFKQTDLNRKSNAEGIVPLKQITLLCKL